MIDRGYEENEPQINVDERGFVASNPTHLMGSWDLALLLCISLSLCFCNVSAHAFYGFVVIIIYKVARFK